MTTLEIAQYYAGLLILQYRGKAKAYATILNLVTPFIIDQLPVAVRDAFDIETAVGVQLDLLGKFAGVTRTAQTFTRTITLNDSDFRVLIKMKVIQNNSGSSLKTIQELIATYFPSSISVFDYQNMHMSYYFKSSLGSEELAEVFVKQGALPKPMGVQLASLIYIAALNNIFAFRTYGIQPGNVSGFNTYASYATDRPWLSYTNAIVV